MVTIFEPIRLISWPEQSLKTNFLSIAQDGLGGKSFILCIKYLDRVVPSGRSNLDPGWVQQNGAPPPWREGAPCLLLEPIEVGCVAAVRAVAGGLGEISPLHELIQRPLDGAAGQAEICGDGLDPRPAGAAWIGPVPEIDVDRLAAVGKLRVRIDGVKVSRGIYLPMSLIRNREVYLEAFRSRSVHCCGIFSRWLPRWDP